MVMKIKKDNVRYEILTDLHVDDIPLVYIPVFTGHPWHEEFECLCGSGPYSLGCSKLGHENCDEFKRDKDGKIKVFLIENQNSNQKCVGCGKDLLENLKPTYNHKIVKKEISEKMEKPGFVGIGAFMFGKLVSFCCGYDYPLEHPERTGSTWYREAIKNLKELGLDPSQCFYHNESGTLEEYRGQNLGTNALRQMLEASPKKSHVVFRTINPAMVRCYEKAFGFSEGRLNPVFSDPNPEKRQDWFVLDLSKLSRKE
jgi:ribosomal protein S18 acetylase RimI-like enzyme